MLGGGIVEARQHVRLRVQGDADVRMAGRSFQEIADTLWWTSRSGPFKAVKEALAKGAQEDVAHHSRVNTRRVNKILSIFWPKMLKGDEGATRICFHAIGLLRAIHGLDAPIRLVMQEEANRLAAELGLDVREVIKEAEGIIRNRGMG